MEPAPRKLTADGEQRSAWKLVMSWSVAKVGGTVELLAKWIVDGSAQTNESTDMNVYATRAYRLSDGLKVFDSDAPENPEGGADANRQINVDE